MANKRLLLVEDDRALADLVTFHFERAGFDVTRTGDGEEALILVDEVTPDVVLLDWMIEGISGIEVCRRLRRRPTTANVPIIMLTARGEEERPHPRARDRRRRLCHQAVQPARAGRARRRGAAPRAPGARRRAADLCRRRDGRRRAPGPPRRRSTLPLGPTEFRLLKHFLEHPGRVFSRERLLDAVWGHDPRHRARTVDVHIRRLRQALNAGDRPDLIRTVRSAGYSLDSDA